MSKPKLTLCTQCNYPFAGPACTNPACDANPSVPEHVKVARREIRAQREAEEAERARIRRIQDAMRKR